ELESCLLNSAPENAKTTSLTPAMLLNDRNPLKRRASVSCSKLRRRRHQSIPEQGKWLRQVVTGFFAYHAVPTNSRALHTFRHRVTDLWRRSLRRQSQKDRMTWSRIKKLADDFLAQARILHPWPHARFAVKHPRWEPSALIGHARICAGCALKAHVTQSPGMATA